MVLVFGVGEGAGSIGYTVNMHFIHGAFYMYLHCEIFGKYKISKSLKKPKKCQIFWYIKQVWMQ